MNTPNPGNFPIGSPESRAAARMLAANRQDTRKRIEIVTNIQRPWHGEGPEPEDWNNEPRIGPWQDCGDTLMRFVYVPHVWLKPGSAVPTCPDCGTSFRKTDRKTDEWPNVVGYEASCVELHDKQAGQNFTRTNLASVPHPQD